ncbi:MAG: hypothetical protein ABI673_10850 [Novosphingobium sp.]
MIAKVGLPAGPALTQRIRRRGQPLVALAVMLGGWTTVRVCALTLMGQSGMGQSEDAVAPVVQAVIPMQALTTGPVKQAARASVPSWQAPTGPLAPIVAAPVLHQLAPLAPASAAAALAPPPLPPVAGPVPQPLPSARLRLAGGHQALWLAALGDIPLPPEFARLKDSPPAPARLAAVPAKPSRWSADGWLMMRRGGGLPVAAAVFAGSYGASQAGAVLRYRLAPGDAHRPSAFLRATTALNGQREQELALGLSARPLAGVPVVAMAELRAARSLGGTRLRPAAALVTELPPLKLPAGLRAEVYAQGGYVGGAFATAFIDGQVRLDRKLFDLGSHELRAGAAGRGAARGFAG